MSDVVEQPAVESPPVRQLVSARPGREFGLDWLRVGAFVILIGYHTGMYFVPWPWSVKNHQTSDWLAWVMMFFNRWRLPLLFFISGAGTWFNLKRRGAGDFARERTRRLMLPLAFGMFVIVPPQIYIERILAGVHYASYFDFWRTDFTFVPYPRGNLSWHHLWFLPYIFTYSILGLPVFVLLRGRWGRAAVERLAGFADRPGVIYLFAIPNILAAVLLGPHWPVTNNLTADWANFTGSLFFFLWGFVICGSDRFLGLIEGRRREFLIAAAVSVALFYASRMADLFGAFSNTERLWIFSIVDSFFAWTMILALVGWSGVALNRDSHALRYANTAVYPFYIVHQTITVLLGYALLGWGAPLVAKFPVLFAGTFVGSWMVYETVRRTRSTRLLFGMKG